MLDGKVLTPSLPNTGAGKPVAASTNSICTPSTTIPVTDSNTTLKGSSVAVVSAASVASAGST